MYKHENKGTGIITVVDDSGNRHVFKPGSIITLDSIHETKGIVCLNKIKQEKKPKIKK